MTYTGVLQANQHIPLQNFPAQADRTGVNQERFTRITIEQGLAPRAATLPGIQGKMPNRDLCASLGYS